MYTNTLLEMSFRLIVEFTRSYMQFQEEKKTLKTCSMWDGLAL